MDVAASDSTVECDGTADPSGAFAAWLSTNGGARMNVVTQQALQLPLL